MTTEALELYADRKLRIVELEAEVLELKRTINEREAYMKEMITAEQLNEWLYISYSGNDVFVHTEKQEELIAFLQHKDK